MSRRALITGISGQDGAYLTELLLEKGYRVFGLDTRPPETVFEHLNHVKDRIVLHQADLLNFESVTALIEEAQPDEIYNFAAHSFVPFSWDEPVLVGDLNGLGVARLLEAIRRTKPDVRFYQASSSEMFGKPDTVPQDEHTAFRPGTPYGTAKLYAHFITTNYRDKLGLYACSGILYNHESPRRPEDFVTRKITMSAARIKAGLQQEVRLGDLHARRDWGYAKDYVRAMWLMLQQPQPDDYVIASGEEHSVGEWVEIAFGHLGLDWRRHVRQDPALLRPVELRRLVGNPAKARARLGWQPSMTFEELVKLMVDADVARLARGGAA